LARHAHTRQEQTHPADREYRGFVLTPSWVVKSARYFDIHISKIPDSCSFNYRKAQTRPADRENTEISLRPELRVQISWTLIFENNLLIYFIKVYTAELCYVEVVGTQKNTLT